MNVIWHNAIIIILYVFIYVCCFLNAVIHNYSNFSQFDNGNIQWVIQIYNFAKQGLFMICTYRNKVITRLRVIIFL